MTPILAPALHAGRGEAGRALVRRLRKAGATSEPAAVPLAPRGRRERAALDRLEHAGVIRRGRGGYWLDTEREREVRHARWRMVAMILIVESGILAAIALYAHRGHG